MKTEAQLLEQQKVSALLLLHKDNSPKARAIRGQIETIDPASATRRQRDRLTALCGQVNDYYEGQSKKQFGKLAATGSNGRGNRGRQG